MYKCIVQCAFHVLVSVVRGCNRDFVCHEGLQTSSAVEATINGLSRVQNWPDVAYLLFALREGQRIAVLL
jgi:hypothetical protein